MRQLIIILSVIAFSCNEIRECDLNPNTELVGVGFYEIPDSTNAKLVDKTVNFLEVANSRNIIFSNLDSINFQFVGLPLDPTANQVSYFFRTDTSLSELLIEYRVNEAALYSLDCGAAFLYDSLRVSSLAFDSVAVSFDAINKNIPVNVEVFF